MQKPVIEALKASVGTALAMVLLWLVYRISPAPFPRFFGWIVLVAVLVSGAVTFIVTLWRERHP